MTAIPERYLRVQVRFTPGDFEAARAGFDCHESQYTAEQRDAINRMLEHGFGGRVHQRPWDGSGERRNETLP